MAYYHHHRYDFLPRLSFNDFSAEQVWPIDCTLAVSQIFPLSWNGSWLRSRHVSWPAIQLTAVFSFSQISCLLPFCVKLSINNFWLVSSSFVFIVAKYFIFFSAVTPLSSQCSQNRLVQPNYKYYVCLFFIFILRPTSSHFFCLVRWSSSPSRLRFTK